MYNIYDTKYIVIGLRRRLKLGSVCGRHKSNLRAETVDTFLFYSILEKRPIENLNFINVKLYIYSN